MLIKIDERQLAHILAGLRLLQAHAMDGYHEAHNFEGILDLDTAMSADEIDTLCETINFGVDEKDVAGIEKQWLSRVQQQGYTRKQQLKNQADFFAGAMVARVEAGMEPGNAMRPGWVISIMRGDLIG